MSYRSFFALRCSTAGWSSSPAVARHRPLHCTRPVDPAEQWPSSALIDKLKRAVGELREQGGRVSLHACDIREEPAVRDTVSAILGEHGHIDGLVNNAGGQFPAPLEAITGKGWDAVVRNNLSGGFLFSRECTRNGWPSTWRRRRADRQHHRRHVARHAGHGAFGCGARRHAQPHRDRVARVGAAARQRGGAGHHRLQRHGPLPAEHKPIILAAANHFPLRRLGTESEVSAAVVFLLSPAAAFISGACLQVDGAGPNARRMWPRVGGKPNEAFNGFHLAELPAILRDA